MAWIFPAFFFSSSQSLDTLRSMATMRPAPALIAAPMPVMESSAMMQSFASTPMRFAAYR